MEEFSVLLKVEGGGPDVFIWGDWEELHPFFFSACSLPFFRQVSRLPSEKRSRYLPTEACAKLSCFS